MKFLATPLTASRRYIAIHQVSLLSHASYSYSAGGVRCPRRQRQRVTEGTIMAPWNRPNHTLIENVVSAQRYYIMYRTTVKATNLNKKHLKNVGPIRHCEPPHAACSNVTLPFTRCRYCRHHYQDEPKPAIAIAQAACDSSDTW